MKPAIPPQQAVNLKNLEILALILSITGVLVLTLWLWILPTWENILLIPGPQARSSSQIELAKTVATIFLAVGVLVTLYLTWRRVNAAEKTIDVAREGQVTERFTRAVDQLGSDIVSVRLGGIYALERIARDSAEDHWPVIQVLVGCVPRRPSLDKQPLEDPPNRSTPTDIQAILGVLGRLNTKYADPARMLDLREADLRGADLTHVNFRAAILIEADFRNVRLNHAKFQGANLTLADFRCANLQNADLQGTSLGLADFRGADLTCTNLQNAELNGADFQWGPIRLTSEGFQGASPQNPHRKTQLKKADFKGASLRNTHFQGADLTNANFEGADLSGSQFGRALALDSGDRFIDDMPFLNTILTGTNFQRSIIRGTDFGTSTDLTQSQLNSAVSDGETKLPDYLSEERRQSQ